MPSPASWVWNTSGGSYLVLLRPAGSWPPRSPACAAAEGTRRRIRAARRGGLPHGRALNPATPLHAGIHLPRDGSPTAASSLLLRSQARAPRRALPLPHDGALIRPGSRPVLVHQHLPPEEPSPRWPGRSVRTSIRTPSRWPARPSRRRSTRSWSARPSARRRCCVHMGSSCRCWRCTAYSITAPLRLLEEFRSSGRVRMMDER